MKRTATPAISDLKERLLLLSEVAEIARSTPAAISQLRHLGKGPRGIKVGKRILYPESAVLEWLNAQAEESGAA